MYVVSLSCTVRCGINHIFVLFFSVFGITQFAANKDSVSCMICFGSETSPFRAQSLKMLSNFSKTHGRSLLCTSDTDAASMACLLITARTLARPLSDTEERHCVSIICQLAYDSCNRAKIRRSGAFKRILELAKNTTSDALLSMVITLCQHCSSNWKHLLTLVACFFRF